jgi:uncharacterized protein (DUF1778 family)
MPRSAAKTTRFETRISPDTLAMVRRAAEIQGRSVSDFVAAAAREKAEEAIATTHIIRLSPRDQEMIADLLEAGPQPPTDGLKRAYEAHARLIRND